MKCLRYFGVKKNHYPHKYICIAHIWSPTLFPRGISTLSEKGDQECPGHDFLMSRSAVRYVSSKARLRNYCVFIF